MVNIIIVEDNKNYRVRTKDIVESYMMGTNVNYTIKTFEKYTDKLRKIIEHNDDGHYVYILDIELQDDDSGIDIANDIRSKHDYDSIIILETGYKELLSEAQRLRLSILDYVCKSINYDKNIVELLDLSLDIFGYKRSVKFQVERVDYNLKYDDIYRIETDNTSSERKCVVITKNKRYNVKKPFYFFEKQLNTDFYKINKGCVININKIKKCDYNKNAITFDNGEILRGNISIRSVKGLRIAVKAKE